MDGARVIRADRRQLRWDIIDLDGFLPFNHRARIVFSFVESLDLVELYDRVRSREGSAGRPAADPAVMGELEPSQTPIQGGSRMTTGSHPKSAIPSHALALE
jgi:hypothetical protein